MKGSMYTEARYADGTIADSVKTGLPFPIWYLMLGSLSVIYLLSHQLITNEMLQTIILLIVNQRL